MRTDDPPGPDPAAARRGGCFVWGRPLRLVDSIAEVADGDAGAIVVSGSHGGASVVRYALQSRPLLVVFNDAGVGLDGAGIAALAPLQAAGIAACTVGHDSARIGEADSTLANGVITRANAAAAALGAAPGRPLREWLLPATSAAPGTGTPPEPTEPAPPGSEPAAP